MVHQRQAALDAGARTVAVVGTGLHHCYPAENRDLQQRITRTGAVISQFLPDARPAKHHFPMRNAVMSGLTVATVVVEAGEAIPRSAGCSDHGLAFVLAEFLRQHEKCLANAVGVTGFQLVTTIPSTRGRTGHPLAEMLGKSVLQTKPRYVQVLEAVPSAPGERSS
ncbi:DNA-processing protein DprA [Actinocrispum sp. NPDC049592]|uniref:DNA-processing protein DprA n=1 Tax=Actinocrispum sp. NPDC049592 TaxID=3154835 RepID=UPI0034324A92